MTIKTEHTPGPWTVDASSKPVQVCRGGKVICTVNQNPYLRAQDTDNAQLIAAAPELKASLEEVLHWIESGCPKEIELMECITDARAVIKKAEGKQ